MSRSKMVCALLAAMIMVLGFAGQARSQDRRRRRNTAEFRERMEQRMKTALGATDEQWKDLKPKVDKVQTLARQARGGSMFRRRRRSTTDEQTDLEKTLAELQKVLENKDAKPEEITAALTAYREALAKVREELEKAQKALAEGLTPRQVAALVALGLLD